LEIKEIQGFPGYYISETGTVYSTKTGEWRERKLQTSYRGYKMVEIRDSSNKPFFKSVHRIVANAFIPNPENKPQVNHIDGNKTNNDVCNLEWCTEAENTAHAIETGLRDYIGEGNPASTTTESQIRQACQLMQDANLSRTEISRITGVWSDTLYKLRAGIAWSHVASEYNLTRPKRISAKLSEDQVKTICELLNAGLPYSQITETTGVGKHTISKIKRGTTYLEISKKYLHEAPTTIESTSEDVSE